MTYNVFKIEGRVEKEHFKLVGTVEAADEIEGMEKAKMKYHEKNLSVSTYKRINPAGISNGSYFGSGFGLKEDWGIK